MALNVNRAVSDPFYRYKMPRLLAKVEGKGNGIKTVIANMTDIAKALERPPTYPTKYFGCELGAQTNFDTKNERYIVNGEHDANKLQDILDGFIRKFVLCPACDNPETTLSVRKQQIHSKCKACGHAFLIDNKHKLSTFILKNPPKKDVDFSKAKEKGVVANEKEKPVGSSSSDTDDDDWAPDAPTVNGLSVQVGKLVATKDLELKLEERLDKLHDFFQEHKNKNTISDGKALADEAERLDLKQKAPTILANVLFDENIIRDGQVKQYRRVLLRFTLEDAKAQRYLLGGVEQLIAKHEETLLPKAAHIVKALYDADVVEETALLAWGEKPTAKYVTKTLAKKISDRCEPVLRWLREADEEDDEVADDDDGAVQFDDRCREAGTVVVEEPKVDAKASKVCTEDGVEVDIDDI